MSRLSGIKRLMAVGLSSLLLLTLPINAWAAGITKPTGSDAGTYTYNDKTGLWENQYFTWSPVTYQYTPKFAQPYTYNSLTGKYDAPDWVYDPTQAKFVSTTISVATPPAGAVVIGGPPPAAGLGTNTAAQTTSPTAGSTIKTTNDSNQSATNNSNLSVNNNIGSTAKSGDAAVSQNTTAGSATTGSATATANVVNLLQSDASLQSGAATFTYDIYGDVQGDLLIDPSQLSAAAGSVPDKLTVNNSTGASINNKIDVAAASGDATVSRNTSAGSATTGNANAVVQIVNVINSIISSGQSFVGTINIYGNFNGDILLPQDTLNHILASNFPTVNATVNPDGSISTINDNSAANINNKVSLTAASGDAAVSRNTSAGNATTGSAGTNLVLLNLTGQQVICGDALLVFVNVLGNWVGMIVNAPAGSTAAALGGGSCSASSMPATNTDINNSANSSISNTVTAGATSGNALVTQNTKAGNAVSGSASASANIANIANSSLSFSSWFGVLFINVFGSWQGSFGINTAAGNPSTPPSTGSAVSTSSGTTVKTVKVFSFVPKTTTSGTTYDATPLSSQLTAQQPGNQDRHPVVLNSTTTNPSGPSAPSHHTSLLWTAGSLFLLAGIISTEEALARRKEARAKLRRYIHGVTVQPFKRY